MRTSRLGYASDEASPPEVVAACYKDGMNETGRVEAFSDGVMAIAITLLVLDLRVPARDALSTSLRHALATQWPNYFAYAVSFLVIGIIWVNHHQVFRIIGAADRVLLFINLLLLMTVAAIPFTTALVAEYLTAGRDARTAAVVYSLVMLAMAIAFSGVYTYAVRRPRLLAEGVDTTAARRSSWRFAAGPVVYALIVGIAFLSAWLCLLVHLLVALYYCFNQVLVGRRTQPRRVG
ncbi:MAG TPA: TMEM175 family protein [Micromonosporaceae bacterium]